MYKTKVLYLWKSAFKTFLVGPRRPQFSSTDYMKFNGIRSYPLLMSDLQQEFMDFSSMEEILDCELFETNGLIKIKIHIMSNTKKYKPSKKRVRVINGITITREIIRDTYSTCEDDLVIYTNRDGKEVHSCPEGFNKVLGLDSEELLEFGSNWNCVVEIIKDFGILEATEAEKNRTERLHNRRFSW